MYKPLDLLAFDTNWPVMNGKKIRNFKDAQVIVKQVPEGMDSPCSVAVTGFGGSSLTFALCTRGGHVVNSSTYLVVHTFVSPPGNVFRASNDYMTVTIVTGDGAFSSNNNPPFLIAPCCVLWLRPSYTPFSMSSLPNPSIGWSREIDYKTNTVIFRAAEPGSTSGSYQPPTTDSNLRSVNGQSPEALSIVADGEGRVDVDGQTITIRPALRDTEDFGRAL